MTLFLYAYCVLKCILMRICIFFIFLIVASISSLSGQDHFLVELENRSPDVKTLVKSYEGFPVIPFKAKDINGVEYSSSSLKGKTAYIWFWNQDCPKCLEHMEALNRVQQENPSTLQVVSFCDNQKDELLEFTKYTKVDFPIIPNSKMFADGPYGGDFGYPRLFIIDEFGVTKYVIPEIEMRGNFDAYGFFDAIQRSLKSK